MIDPTLPLETWDKELTAARRWREQREQTWAFYALLHRRLVAYRTRGDAVCDEDEALTTPHGDNVRVGTIFRNLEQTFALLDLPEIGVRAKVTDYWREQKYPDVHRESIAETALFRSMMRSGLMRGESVADLVDLDAVIIGHGVSYSHWSQRKRMVEEQVPVLRLDEFSGTYLPVFGDDGLPRFDVSEREEIVWEGVQDEHVPVLEFLFESTAKQISTANWHGREWVQPLDDLRQDDRFEIPDWIEGGSISRKLLYGEDSDESTELEDAVLGVTVYDKRNGELLHFIDAPNEGQPRNSSSGKKRESALVLIGAERSPVLFAGPSESPFNVYVPIPAQEDASGISQIEHIRGLAAEIDVLRSRIANMTALLKRVFLYEKGRVSQEEIDAALEARDFSFIGITRKEETEDLTKLFHEFPLPAVRAEFYKLSGVAASDVTQVSGVQEDPWAGGSSATEAEHKFNIGSARIARKKRLKFRFLSELAHTHLDLMRAFGPDGEPMVVESVTGPLLLEFGREALQGEFMIEVTAGGGATAVSPVQQKMALEAANLIMPSAGPFTKMALTRQLLTMMDIRDVSGIMQAARQDMALAAGQPMGPGGGQPPPENIALGDYGVGQAIRGGVNAPWEGGR
jgi:hypothetical protein